MSLFVYRSRKFNRLYGLTLFLYSIWFLVGLVVLAFQLETPMGSWADFTYIALASLVLLLHLSGQSHGGSALLIFCIFVMVAGLVEGLGALTGVPFGSYEYSNQFGPMIFGVLPWAIPLSWWVIVWPLHCLVHSALAGRGTVTMVPVLTAVGAVVVDLIIEPAATHGKGYWIWQSPGVYYGVPWTNFLAWFGIAFVLSFLAQLFLPHSPFKREELRVPVWVLGSTVFTFVVMSLAFRQWWVLLVAAVFFLGVRRLLKQARSTSLSQ
ncbi:MAG: carotenoid biosynthesis protein [Puniceicoccales bacterium]